ncbi:putative Eukaryotic translation initiation factor 5 [Blattamonas nauphoetae]|uniref:Eukaryotic translation initiation factor 5 n=1 Tax=Blattamonas nauphoetae TaxID=2049346 RepID=A0ABQ9YC66_9EUKA|nr:putative Eukaryotic translation initiation factor 5 [Blattamonas nauphoetae]
MAKTEDIGGDGTDFAYRYKMEKLQTKTEGRGNGIKTVIPNFGAVSGDLHRSPHHLAKFFGAELGSISKYNDQTHGCTVNGSHTFEALRDVLNKFIRTFVLCAKCGNPETNMSISGKDLILTCQACGHQFRAAPGHKLTNAIVQEFKGKKGKGDKHEKEAQEDENEGSDTGIVADIDVEEAPAHSRHDRKHRSRREGKENDEDKEKRRKERSDKKKADKEIVVDPVTAELAKKMQDQSRAFQEDKRQEAKERRSYRDHPMMVEFDKLFPLDAPLTQQEIESKKEQLLKRKGQMGQLAILYALERQMMKRQGDESLQEFNFVLNALYQNDICHEVNIRTWYQFSSLSHLYGIDKTTSEKVRNKCKDFIEFIEEEDKEEEEKADEVDEGALDDMIDNL